MVLLVLGVVLLRSRAGYVKITVADTGNGIPEEQLEKIFKTMAEEAPDLVLSDVVMPGKSGYDLCRRIKDDLQLCHVPVVLVTAKATVENQVEGLTGENPGQFFKTYKLNRAAELLKTGKYTVSEIADMTGFSTLSHFSTTFRKHFGTTPSDYK